MTEATYLLDQPEIAAHEPFSDKKVSVSYGDRPNYVAGRRAWVKYRELGVTAASGGEMRAQVISAGEGDNKPTGWHLHRCDMQFLFGLKGAIHIAFSPDHIVTLGEGDAMMIPGGVIHMELGEPSGVEVLEVSIPAEMGTEAVESPWGDVEVVFNGRAVPGTAGAT